MLRTYLTVICVIASASASQFPVSSVSASKDEKPLNGVRGVVNSTDCGTLGELIQTRVSGCDQFPCALNAQSTIEIDYRVRANITKATLRLRVTPTGLNHFVSTQNIGPLTVGADNTLTLNEFKEDVTSQEVTIQAEVLTDSAETEICVSGLFHPASNGAGMIVSASIGMVAVLFGAMQI